MAGRPVVQNNLTPEAREGGRGKGKKALSRINHERKRGERPRQSTNMV